MRHTADLGLHVLDVDAHMFPGAHDGGGKVAAMRDGKIVRISGNIRFSAFEDADLVHGEVWEELAEEVPAREVLEAFVGVVHAGFYVDCRPEKCFFFTNFPHSQLRGGVDLYRSY
jgi:hypothetical protein